MAEARFVAGKTLDFLQAAKVYSMAFTSRLTDDERRDFISMLEEVARIEGGPTEVQSEDIAAVQRIIQVAPATT